MFRKNVLTIYDKVIRNLVRLDRFCPTHWDRDPNQKNITFYLHNFIHSVIESIREAVKEYIKLILVLYTKMLTIFNFKSIWYQTKYFHPLSWFTPPRKASQQWRPSCKEPCRDKRPGTLHRKYEHCFQLTRSSKGDLIW